MSLLLSALYALHRGSHIELTWYKQITRLARLSRLRVLHIGCSEQESVEVFF